MGRTVPPEGAFVDISASGRRTCGVRASGELACWGKPWRESGAVPSGEFVKVSLGTFASLETDAEEGCGIRVDASLVCWDSQWDHAWELIEPLEGRFADVSAQSRCAVRESGKLACWGDDVRNRVFLPQEYLVEIVDGGWPHLARLCALGEGGRAGVLGG